MPEPTKRPMHSEGCLRRHANDAVCGPPCELAVWLDEPVSRALARHELLGELATWAHEQRVFAESQMLADPDAHPLAGTPGWRKQAVRSGAVMAQEVFLDVRRRALAQQEECDEALRRQERAAEKAAKGEREEVVAAAAPLPPARAQPARPDAVVTVAVQEALL